jgi:tetratricopeptide (TPR) repeat protein
MIPSPVGHARNVIPRWRSLKRTLAARELAMPARKGEFETARALTEEFRGRLEAWRREPHVISAAELLEIAFVEGHEREALNAARALVGKHFSPTALVRDQARRLLERAGEMQPTEAAEDANADKCLHFWRRRTRNYPADSLAWVELARIQFAVGLNDDAQRSMLVGRQLAPNNRHVIRSAARMFLHLHQPEVAHRVIRNCEASRHDPWLTAAEIAIASHRKTAPQLFKTGVSLLESERFLPHQINELAAAVGTAWLVDGNRKRGKRMIAQGLVDPTGNTLAQAEWITQVLREPVLEPLTLTYSIDANEAKTLRLFKLGKFESSLDFAERWIAEEPFSNRAYIAGVAAASASQNYSRTILLANRGLRFDPHSKPILNNKVFALACSGSLDEAERILESISIDDGPNTSVAEANRGLIAFRRGLNDFGIAQYRLAISGFNRIGDVGNERIAYAYLAREAVRSNDPQAKAFVDEAEGKLAKADAPQARNVLGEAKTMLELWRAAASTGALKAG